MKKGGNLAFAVGFALAAIPLTFWLLSLSYGDNGWRVAVAVVIEFLTGFASQALFLKHRHKKIKAI